MYCASVGMYYIYTIKLINNKYINEVKNYIIIFIIYWTCNNSTTTAIMYCFSKYRLQFHILTEYKLCYKQNKACK